MLQQAYADAEAHYQRGQDALALQLFSSLIELAPQYREAAWLRVGNIHQRAGAGGAALDAYRQLLPVPGQTPAQGSDAGLEALRLKGMVNLLTLSMQQTEAALSHIALLQQDPAVRTAAGLNAEAEAALVQGLLDQAARIQQMLGQAPRSAVSAASGYAQQRQKTAVTSHEPAGRRTPAGRTRSRTAPPQILIGNPVDPVSDSVPQTGSTAAPVSDSVPQTGSPAAPVSEPVSLTGKPVASASRSASLIGNPDAPAASRRPVIEYLDAPARGQ